MATSACAVDNTGFLAAEITSADGALVADLYSLGLQLRTTSADQGVTLGYQRRSYVFAQDEVPVVEPGWYYGHVPLPEDAFIAMNARSYGLELQASPPDLGLSIGFRESTRLRPIEQDHDGAVLLSYQPEFPAKTQLTICNGASQCARLDQER